MAEIFRPPFFQVESAAGIPLAGAKLYFYTTGTTTPITVYQDVTLVTPHASPVVADANGTFPSIYLAQNTYKIALYTSADVLVKTVDNINSTSSGSTVLDGTFRVQNTTDATKQIAFSAAGITSGQTRTVTVPDKSGTLAMTSDIPVTSGFVSSTKLLVPSNLGFLVSAAASALTIALKGVDGNDPSASNPVVVPFRSVTAGTGTPDPISVTAANSLVISSGSTLGAPTGSTPFKVWVVAFNDGGTFRLGAILCTTLASGALVQYPLGGWGIASSTAEGGAGAADSAQTFYTGTAVTSKAYTVLAVLSLETGLATAGTWAAAPTRVQLFDWSVPLPGRVVQVEETPDGAVATGTTQIPEDDSIPQNTEGDQFLSRSITPISAANVLRYTTFGVWTPSGNVQLILATFRDATANALSAVKEDPSGAGNMVMLESAVTVLASSTSATTFKTRVGGTGASTQTFNGEGGARLFGGVSGSYNRVEEIAS